LSPFYGVDVVPALLGQVAGFASSRQLNICGERRFADLAASSLISHAAHSPYAGQSGGPEQRQKAAGLHLSTRPPAIGLTLR
jgi:hypothetical protein